MGMLCRCFVSVLLVLFVLFFACSLTVVTCVTATSVTVNSGTSVGYITLKVNNTGTWITVPGFSKLVNLTYGRIFFGVYAVNSTCVKFYLYKLPSMEQAVADADLYVVDNNTLLHVAKLSIAGYGTYCNYSLANYTMIVVVLHYNGTTIPVGVIKGLAPKVSIPDILKPYVPLIALAVIAPVGLWFNMRKMAFGLIAMGALFLIVSTLFSLAQPWWQIFSIMMIFTGIVMIVIVEKYPEQE